jgi:hypothetical protein
MRYSVRAGEKEVAKLNIQLLREYEVHVAVALHLGGIMKRKHVSPPQADGRNKIKILI